MEDQETPQNAPSDDHESLAERVTQLESRVAHLEKTIESIAKMENAISGLFGGTQGNES